MGFDTETRRWLEHLLGADIGFDRPMARHTSFRVGGPADALAAPASLETLTALVSGCRQRQIPYLVIGGGTNLLVRDGGVRGVVIDLSNGFGRVRNIEAHPDGIHVTVGAGMRTQRFCRYAIDHGLAGMNFALGIPGSVGGGLRVNAGTARGWMNDVLESVQVLRCDGRIKRIPHAGVDFSYRRMAWKPPLDADPVDPIIIAGTFRLAPAERAALAAEADAILAERRRRQPIQLPSAGCIFKNPPQGEPAGRLIDTAGLKDTRIGDAVVSDRHANFIVNAGHATAADILSLMAVIQETVKARFGIELEPEVQIIGTSHPEKEEPL